MSQRLHRLASFPDPLQRDFEDPAGHVRLISVQLPRCPRCFLTRPGPRLADQWPAGLFGHRLLRARRPLNIMPAGNRIGCDGERTTRAVFQTAVGNGRWTIALVVLAGSVSIYAYEKLTRTPDTPIVRPRPDFRWRHHSHRRPAHPAARYRCAGTRPDMRG